MNRTTVTFTLIQGRPGSLFTPHRNMNTPASHTPPETLSAIFNSTSQLWKKGRIILALLFLGQNGQKHTLWSLLSHSLLLYLVYYKNKWCNSPELTLTHTPQNRSCGVRGHPEVRAAIMWRLKHVCSRLEAHRYRNKKNFLRFMITFIKPKNMTADRNRERGVSHADVRKNNSCDEDDDVKNVTHSLLTHHRYGTQ